MWCRKGMGCLEAEEGRRTLGGDLYYEVRRSMEGGGRTRVVLLSHEKIQWKKGENSRSDPNQLDGKEP